MEVGQTIITVYKIVESGNCDNDLGWLFLKHSLKDAILSEQVLSNIMTSNNALHVALGVALLYQDIMCVATLKETGRIKNKHRRGILRSGFF